MSSKHCNTWHLYMAGLLLPDAEYKAEIAQELIRRAEAEWLYYIGRDWPDKRYTPAIPGR